MIHLKKILYLIWKEGKPASGSIAPIVGFLMNPGRNSRDIDGWTERL